MSYHNQGHVKKNTKGDIMKKEQIAISGVGIFLPFTLIKRLMLGMARLSLNLSLYLKITKSQGRIENGMNSAFILVLRASPKTTPLRIPTFQVSNPFQRANTVNNHIIDKGMSNVAYLLGAKNLGMKMRASKETIPVVRLYAFKAKR